jgi:hypothetical protein
MKIKSLLVIILLLIFSINISVNTSAIKTNNTKENPEQLQLPIWKKDQYWEYKMDFGFADTYVKLISFYVRLQNLVVQVTDITNDYYILDLTGDFDKVFYNYVELHPLTGYLKGDARINKNTLGVKNFTLNFIGIALGQELIEINVIMNFTEELEYLQFPMAATLGNTWEVNTSYNLIILMKLAGDVIYAQQIKNRPFKDTFIIKKSEIIKDIPAGEYYSHLIKGQMGKPSKIWFSPDAGYIVEIDETIPGLQGLLDLTCDMKLISTNYAIDNNPPVLLDITHKQSEDNKWEYNYTITSEDPENDYISYKIKYDDQDEGTWMGPYPSGTPLEIKHQWDSRGSHFIQVKTKDIKKCESPWSEPYTTNVKGGKIYTFSLNKYISKIPFLFPLIQKILKTLFN